MSLGKMTMLKHRMMSTAMMTRAAILVAEELLRHSVYLSAEVWHGNKLVARIAPNPAEAANAQPPNVNSPQAAQ